MVDSMEEIVNLCKQRGYVYPGSEIYVDLQIHGIMVHMELNLKII